MDSDSATSANNPDTASTDGSTLDSTLNITTAGIFMDQMIPDNTLFLAAAAADSFYHTVPVIESDVFKATSSFSSSSLLQHPSWGEGTEIREEREGHEHEVSLSDQNWLSPAEYLDTTSDPADSISPYNRYRTVPYFLCILCVD